MGIRFEHNPSPKPVKVRPTKTATCAECGITFSRRSDSINRHKTNYCSPFCANKANGRKAVGRVLPTMRTGRDVQCIICKKTFYVSGSRLKKNPKFCSNKCQGIFQRESAIPKGFITGANNKGANNGRYKDGKRVGTNITKPKVRLAVIERDGPYCLLCGKPGPGLHLHRVVYGSECGKYVPDNCVLLCNIDHEKVHSNKREWKPKLLEHISKKSSNNAV